MLWHQISFICAFLNGVGRTNDSPFPFLVRGSWASPGEGINKQYIALYTFSFLLIF
jgi:hypothetical protein